MILRSLRRHAAVGQRLFWVSVIAIGFATSLLRAQGTGAPTVVVAGGFRVYT